MTDDRFELVEGSGNVFRDLGDPHADIKQAKAVLAALDRRIQVTLQVGNRAAGHAEAANTG